MLTFAEFKEKSSLVTLSLREKYYRKMVFNVGDIVEDATGVFEILDRGTNYVTVVNESGIISKKFIAGLMLSEKAMQYADNSFKGFVPGEKFMLDESAVRAFGATITKYEDGTITDAIAVLKSLDCVNSVLEGNTESAYAAKQSLERIGEWNFHENYLQPYLGENMQINSNDKLKVASVIADTLGSASAGTNPEMIVNKAISTAHKNGSITNEESLKIIHRMLDLAQEVGIKYDTTIIPQKLEEISRATVDSYVAKSKESRPNKLSKVITRFAGQERAQDRVNKDELKKIDKKLSESYRPGMPVKVTHENGGTMHGMVKGIHGSVIAVQHGNNRVTYHHNYKISPHAGPVTKPDVKTFADITKDRKVVTDLGKSIDDSPESPVPMASSMNPTSDTNRRQLATKLLEPK